MRIIAGKYRHLNLMTLEGADTRPTKDMVKEALFSSLGDIEGLSFLDLFAGSGAVGIEALSRGAFKATFNDINPKACKIIKANLQKLAIEAKVYNEDWQTLLKHLKGESFDIIFADPPYAFEDYDSLFSLLEDYGLLKNKGLLIIENRKGTTIDCPYDHFNLLKIKTYGISQLNYFMKEE